MQSNLPRDSELLVREKCVCCSVSSSFFFILGAHCSRTDFPSLLTVRWVASDAAVYHARAVQGAGDAAVYHARAVQGAGWSLLTRSLVADYREPHGGLHSQLWLSLGW